MKRMNRLYEWNLPKLEGLVSIAKLMDPLALGEQSVFHRYYTGPKDQIQTAEMLLTIMAKLLFDAIPGVLRDPSSGRVRRYSLYFGFRICVYAVS
jgi:hypothetical protein